MCYILKYIYGLNNLNEFLHLVHVYENALYNSFPCMIYFLIDTARLVASSLGGTW